ncbi:MAG TPA: lipopolysaccharide biosynthesis protein [Syntrophorhabdaceae bacterium]|nr:lipopolysaccharide biosynthesis protein [Syntrophorhabdaceae bacterium]
MKDKVISSIKWSALSEIASKALPPLFYIITARLLTPEDFGIVATSSMVVAFASIFWEAGLSKALIQNQDYEVQKMSNIVFYTNVFLSLLIYLVLFMLSDFIASFFKDNRVSSVLKVSGLSLIIGSFMSVQTALLQRNFEFKKIFYSRFVGAIVPGIVSIVFAYYGFGYWALVYGTIFSMFIQVVILWKISKWLPTLDYDLKIAKKMFDFSRWVFLSSFLSWFYIWGDIFVLGFFFTSHEVGLYRTGNYLVSTIFGFVTTPILPVMYSYFSGIQHNKEEVKRVLLLSSKVLSFIVLPIGVGLYILKNPLSDLIFGGKWVGIAPVIGYLALTYGFAWIVGLNTEAYKAIKKPYIEFYIHMISIPIYLTVFFISSSIGFEVFLIARLLLVFVGMSIQYYFLKKTLCINFSKFFGNFRQMFIISILLIFANHLLMNNFLMSNFVIIIIFFALITSYFIYMYILDKNLFTTLFKILKNAKQTNSIKVKKVMTGGGQGI